ncbi:isochorismate synthase [Nocardiopsis trehalosi]|uniref:isochorismate synthase n=1 Tax=Nocardiopsis trehalosi TaxID=109329 RepID=UPI00082B378D|nr:isochorismate synthase [Nocardiopsis trehalosi]
MSHQRAATPAPAAADLLDAYRPGAQYFASREGALLGTGVLATADRLDALPGLLADATADPAAPAVAIGALPFAPDAPARLVVPAEVRRAPAPAGTAPGGDRGQRPLAGPWRVRPVPEPADHVAAVDRLLKHMADAGPGDDALRKVVLARALRLTGPGPVDVAQLLRNLAWRDPAAHAFAVDLPPAGGDVRTLVGASPELLVAKRGGTATANPLAGSAPRSADPTRDQQRAVALLTSAKDRYEHAVVVEAVAEGLRPFCRTLDVPAEPELARTATMWHLSTRVTGELRDPATPSADLVRALHPTPAVCGTPTADARDAIAAAEPFDRGFYTGVVGHTDARGDGEWVVTIRCADVAGAEVDLFAGGGIVAGSDPEAELAETSAKLRTLLLALGINQPL